MVYKCTITYVSKECRSGKILFLFSSDFNFQFMFIAFIIFLFRESKKQTPVFLFLSNNIAVYLEIWCSLIFPWKLCKSWERNDCAVFSQKPGFCLKEQSLKSLVTSSPYPVYFKSFHLYHHPKNFLEHKTCL